MRSRWYHKPVLHAPAHADEGKTVSWLELFFDLIFVAAIIQLGDYLSEDVSIAGFLKFSGHFVPLWIAWSGFTFYANRFNVDDFLHRTMVLAMMFAVGVMAISSHQAMAGHPATFAVAYAIAQGIVSLLHVRSWVQVPESRAYSRYWGAVFAVGAGCFAISALVPVPYTYLLWALGVLVILSAPFSDVSRQLIEQYPTDQEHLSERYGLLTIIVLGESFVKVLSYLTAGGHVDTDYLLKGFFNLTLTVSIWWIYFDDVAGAELKKGRGSWVIWFLAHIPVTLAITAVGVAVKKAIKFEVMVPAPDSYRWLLAGTLALTLVSVAIIDSVTERQNSELTDRNRVTVRFLSAVIVLLLGAVGGSMSAGLFLGLVATVCMAQVIIDMMMAPFEESAETHQATGIAELYEQRKSEGRGASTVARPNLSNTVRKGAPSHLRRDMYFFFIEGSWTRLMASFAFAFVFLNVFFAAIFQLAPGAIGGDTDQSFADAFFFSVQTLSSLGYGAMSPATPWGDLVVTLEAAVGMLFVALATGLIFAKASRPQASVLFSESMVLTVRHGVPTLMLRAANARGNEVVDATMTVSALMEEVSPEGHHMRRLHDLALVRATSPVFAMTWLAMHEVDENSPLQDANLDDLMVIIVTMVGHDGTYGQTTYARHMYGHDDIRRGHRFVDVISQLPDGRSMIDLSRFHDTDEDPDVLALLDQLRAGEPPSSDIPS